MVGLFFGSKLYSIHQIQQVMERGTPDEFSPSSKIDFIPSKMEANNEIDTKFFSFKTYEKFSDNRLKDDEGYVNLFKKIPDAVSYTWESKGEYKTLNFFNNNRLGIFESIKTEGNTSFLPKDITSEFDLHSYCFSLDLNNLTVFSTFHEIKIGYFCMVIRCMFIPKKGAVFSFALPNSLNVIQIGRSVNESVYLYFYHNKTALFSLSLNNFSDDDFELLLNTIEIKH